MAIIATEETEQQQESVEQATEAEETVFEHFHLSSEPGVLNTLIVHLEVTKKDGVSKKNNKPWHMLSIRAKYEQPSLQADGTRGQWPDRLSIDYTLFRRSENEMLFDSECAKWESFNGCIATIAFMNGEDASFYSEKGNWFWTIKTNQLDLNYRVNELMEFQAMLDRVERLTKENMVMHKELIAFYADNGIPLPEGVSTHTEQGDENLSKDENPF